MTRFREMLSRHSPVILQLSANSLIELEEYVSLNNVTITDRVVLCELDKIIDFALFHQFHIEINTALSLFELLIYLDNRKVRVFPHDILRAFSKQMGISEERLDVILPKGVRPAITAMINNFVNMKHVCNLTNGSVVLGYHTNPMMAVLWKF